MRRTRLLLGGALSLLIGSVCISQAETPVPVGLQSFEINRQPLPYFRIGHEDQTIFGELEYIGGAVLTSSNEHFGALSGILSLNGGKQVLAVSDTGFWITWSPGKAGDQTSRIITDAAYAPMLGAVGQPLLGKSQADAEAIARWVHDGKTEYLVAFEGRNRISAWPAPPARAAVSRSRGLPTERIAGLIRFNKGIEGMAVAPEASRVAGAILALTERGQNPAADMNGWLLGGPLPGGLKVKRRGNYDLTDAAFLPDGDLLILERRFNLKDGIGMRIRRIPGSTVRPGAILDGPKLIEADLGYQIDNMEGLDVHRSEQGDIILTLISDNNHSILQRTLFLRFKMKKGAVREANAPDPIMPRAHPARGG